MMGWLIALGVLVLLAAVPLGVGAVYDCAGAKARLLIGPFSFPIYPSKKEDTKEEDEASAQEEKSESKQSQKAKGGALADFLPLVGVAIDFLGELRRKIRVKRLEMKLVMAGEDPCDLAVNYGRAWAAIGNMIPQLERLFVIKKRDIDVQCDFSQTSPSIYVRLDITISLGRLLSLVTRYGIRALRVMPKNTGTKKGGAVK